MSSTHPPDYEAAVKRIFPSASPDLELGLDANSTASRESPTVADQEVVTSAPPTSDLCDVVYTYIPQWPLAGQPKEILGPLYPDREQTVNIVKKRFIDLQGLPSARIELSCPLKTAALGEHARWTTILDESWGSILAHPPSAIRVQVADLPGDAAARDAHYQAMRDQLRCHRFTYFFFVLSAVILVIVLPVYFTQR